MTLRDLAFSTLKVTVSQRCMLSTWKDNDGFQVDSLPVLMPLSSLPVSLPPSIPFFSFQYNASERLERLEWWQFGQNCICTTFWKTETQNSQTARTQDHMLLVYCCIPRTLHSVWHIGGIQGILFWKRARMHTHYNEATENVAFSWRF